MRKRGTSTVAAMAPRRVRGASSRRVSRSARRSGTATFISSDGCSVSGPTTSQERAPPRTAPISSTATRSATPPAHTGRDSRRRSTSRRRDAARRTVRPRQVWTAWAMAVRPTVPSRPVLAESRLTSPRPRRDAASTMGARAITAPPRPRSRIPSSSAQARSMSRAIGAANWEPPPTCSTTTATATWGSSRGA